MSEKDPIPNVSQDAYEKIMELVDELTGEMSAPDLIETLKELDSEIDTRLHLAESEQ